MSAFFWHACTGSAMRCSAWTAAASLRCMHLLPSQIAGGQNHAVHGIHVAAAPLVEGCGQSAAWYIARVCMHAACTSRHHACVALWTKSLPACARAQGRCNSDSNARSVTIMITGPHAPLFFPACKPPLSLHHSSGLMYLTATQSLPRWAAAFLNATPLHA